MGDAGDARLYRKPVAGSVKSGSAHGPGSRVQDRAAAWEALLEKGSKAFVEKLWNGRYFSLWADGDKRDDCCMTDQIDGQWYARLLGLGNFLP